MTKRANKKRTIRDIQSSLTPVTESGSSLFTLPRSLFHIIFGENLNLKEVARFDNTVLNHDQRVMLMDNLSGMTAECFRPSSFCLRWLFQRRIKLTSLTIEFSYGQLEASSFVLFPLNLSVLKRLNIPYDRGSLDKLTVESVVRSLKHCKQLQSISVSSSNSLFTGLFEFPEFYSNIETLTLDGRIIESVISKLAVGCPNLNTISLDFLDNASEAGIIEFVVKCGHRLKFITFTNSAAWSTLVAWSITQCCPLLTYLDAAVSVSDRELAAFGAKCPLLTDFSVERQDWTDVGLMALAKGCPLIKAFCLTGSFGTINITDKSIIQISKFCTLLEHLSLNSQPHLTDESLRAIGRYCKCLQVLCLTDLAFSSEGFISCFGSPNLKGLKYVSFEAVAVDDDAILELVRNVHESLTGLSFKNCEELTDVGMLRIAEHCRMLNLLSLENLPCLSHPRYIADIFRRNPNLTSINCTDLDEKIVRDNGMPCDMLMSVFNERR